MIFSALSLLLLVVVVVAAVLAAPVTRVAEWLLDCAHDGKVPEALDLQAAYRGARQRDLPYAKLPGKSATDDGLLLVDLAECHRVSKLFLDRGLPKNERANPLSTHIFSLEAARWRTARSAVSRGLVFSPSQLKDMFGLHALTARDLQAAVRSQLGRAVFADLDLKDLIERFVTDDMGRTLFSCECDTLRHPGNTFHRHCASDFSQSLWRRFRQFMMKRCPSLMVLVPYRRKSAEFFQGVVDQRRAARHRDRAPCRRGNLLDAMLDAEEAATNPDEAQLLRSVGPGQVFATFRAGFEATAATILFALLEIAYNPDIQQRLQRELDATQQPHGTDLSSDMLQDMKYLDMVVKETLRKYPPNASLVRTATSDDAAACLPKGAKAVVPVFAIHHDEAFFPDPELFDPERFGRDAVAATTAHSYLPFGLGPRGCLARLYALHQVKVGLIAVLKSFSVAPGPSTPTMPLEFLAGRDMVLALKQQDSCYLRVSTREPGEPPRPPAPC